MNSKIAKLSEHLEIKSELIIESGHGVLPSTCKSCGGALDFVRIQKEDRKETVLQCRICHEQIA